MSEVTRSRGYALVLVGVVSFIALGCSTTPAPDPGPPVAPGSKWDDFCVSGRGTRNFNKPIICVDDSGNVHPTEVRIHDVQATVTNTPSSHAVKIRWYTVSPGRNLAVSFLPGHKGCSEKVICDGTGYCYAKVKKTSGEQRCEYAVNLDGRMTDPIIIVRPCCMVEDPSPPPP